jgi:hypothetical protein
MSAKFFYEQIYFIDENGKALDENWNEFRDEDGKCVYISEEDRSFFTIINS